MNARRLVFDSSSEEESSESSEKEENFDVLLKKVVKKHVKCTSSAKKVAQKQKKQKEKARQQLRTNLKGFHQRTWPSLSRHALQRQYVAQAARTRENLFSRNRKYSAENDESTKFSFTFYEESEQ